MKTKKVEVVGFETTQDSILIKYRGHTSPVVGIVEFKDISQRVKEKK